VTVYLVRHAKAGSRRQWEGADDERPLSKAGRRQAAELVATLGTELRDTPPAFVLTSPYLRCRETVAPLAASFGLSVEVIEELAEGSSFAHVERVLEKVGDVDVVLCTHGDVIGHVLGHALRHGVALPDDRMEKGSTWVLEREAGAVVGARYVPPPS
jgi:broad specificity phosphatase PhoE